MLTGVLHIQTLYNCKREKMSKISKSKVCHCNTSTFLIKWEPRVYRTAPLGGYKGPAKASKRCNLSSACPRVLSTMSMPQTPPRGNVWKVSWPHAHMTSAGFFGSERAECPALSYFWLAELLALSICMNPATLQKNFGHSYLQTSQTRALCPLPLTSILPLKDDRAPGI